MKARFVPEPEAASHSSPRLVDPEAYDASEQQFAASLENHAVQSQFVVSEEPAAEIRPEASQSQGLSKPDVGARASANAEHGPDALSDSWRKEVTAKVSRYRSRTRPRAPRYPSLQLKFDALDTGATARALSCKPDPVEIEDIYSVSAIQPAEETPPAVASPPTAKILEFPVFFTPPRPTDELAEPVMDRPRILEVPEVAPPPPALGGILMEPSEEVAKERRPGFELPLIAAPFSRRLFAAAIDAVIVASAFALFAYAFFRITAVVPGLPLAAGASAGLLAIFWMGYQYLLLVYAGITPGLKLAKLRLSRFDGTNVPRKLRRWRVLASFLAGLSLGLGYAWCFLDEDQLCWHDRITHTYMAPTTPP